MRSRSPTRCRPPAITQRAHSSRPTRTATSSFGTSSAPILRSCSATRSRPTTVKPSTRFRSDVTVSAMPAPSQSSSPLPLMLAKPITATLSGKHSCGVASVWPSRTASRSRRNSSRLG